MNMRQGSKNDNGLVRIGFLYTRKQPAGLSEPGPFNKTGFFTRTRLTGSGPNHKPKRNPEISYKPKITNHIIFM